MDKGKCCRFINRVLSLVEKVGIKIIHIFPKHKSDQIAEAFTEKKMWDFSVFIHLLN